MGASDPPPRFEREYVVLRAPEDLDMQAAPAFTEELDSVPPSAELVIDLTDTSFLDSNGIRVLIRALNRQDEGGGSLVLNKPRASVFRVLELCGLDDRFTIRR